jgi:prepilin peptidase CpaA
VDSFHSAVLLVGLVACAWDLRTRRIPNWLTFGAAATGFVALAMTGGTGGMINSLAGWACGVALFFPWFALRGMGGGDIKLLAAFGAWLGPADTLQIALHAALAGGVLALATATAHNYLGTLLANLRLLATTWAVAGPCAVEALTLDTGRGPRLAYAVPLTIGAVVTLWR